MNFVLLVMGLGVLGAALGAFFVVRAACPGYEDHQGFHFGEPAAGEPTGVSNAPAT